MKTESFRLPFAVAFMLVIIQAAMWSYKTSGVLDQTTLWAGYPWGFRYILKNTPFGDWPINKENLYYIRQQLAFLGNLTAHIDKGAGFECHRVLYSFLGKGLWFLGPIFSGIVLNICFWILAVASAMACVLNFTNNHFSIWCAALLTASGQGFVYSVGEISPHVMGYASSFIILALACQGRIWKRDSSFNHHILVYLIVGLLQLGYNSPWLMLPVLLCLSFIYEWQPLHNAYSSLQLSVLSKPIRRLCLLIAVAVVPSMILTIGTMPVGGESIVGFLWRTATLGSTHFSLLSFLKSYVLITADGFLALGPVLVALYLLVGVMALIKRSSIIIFAFLLFSLQILICGIFLMPVAGRGYVTFGITALLLCSGSYCLGLLWETKNRFFQMLATAFPLGSLIYANLPLLGYRLPSLAFFDGFYTFFVYGQWQAYATKIFS